jgi:hypothetical protein
LYATLDSYRLYVASSCSIALTLSLTNYYGNKKDKYTGLQGEWQNSLLFLKYRLSLFHKGSGAFDMVFALAAKSKGQRVVSHELFHWHIETASDTFHCQLYHYQGVINATFPSILYMISLYFTSVPPKD